MCRHSPKLKENHFECEWCEKDFSWNELVEWALKNDPMLYYELLHD